MRLRVLLCMALVAACGSDNRRTATKSATPDRASDKQIAEQSGLELEDFPSGWKKVGEGGGEDMSCNSVVAAQGMTTAHWTGDRFGREILQSESTVYVFADEATARKGYEQLTSAETPKCLADAMAEGLGRASGEVKFGKTRTSSLQVEAPGDEARGARVMAPFTSRGVKGEVDADLVFARTGRGVALIAFVSAFEPFDESLRGQLTKTAVSRLTQALGAG
jgi:hypothetical protein